MGKIQGQRPRCLAKEAFRFVAQCSPTEGSFQVQHARNQRTAFGCGLQRRESTGVLGEIPVLGGALGQILQIVAHSYSNEG